MCLQRQLRDRSLMLGSGATAKAKALEEAQLAVAETKAGVEREEGERVRGKAVYGETLAAVVNLYQRTISTAPVNCLPPIKGEWRDESAALAVDCIVNRLSL